MFKKIDDIKSYVEQLIEGGQKPKLYVKATPIMATRAVAGEEVLTYVKAEDGGQLLETTNTAIEGDWIVANPDGEQYIVHDAKFHEIYGPSNEEGKRLPLAKPRTLIQISEDITFPAPWGGEMNIQAGGQLNIDNMDGIYGINPEEFATTHSPVEPEKGNNGKGGDGEGK